MGLTAPRIPGITLPIASVVKLLPSPTVAAAQLLELSDDQIAYVLDWARELIETLEDAGYD